MTDMTIRPVFQGYRRIRVSPWHQAQRDAPPVQPTTLSVPPPRLRGGRRGQRVARLQVCEKLHYSTQLKGENYRLRELPRGQRERRRIELPSLHLLGEYFTLYFIYYC